MIDKIIAGYITANRRLVIPEFGAFIRKDDNSVVFVPFLKKDDGVLKGLITQSLSLNSAEAAQMLDEYVLCIKQKLLHRQGYIIEGLGQLKSDANGILYLDYNPAIEPLAAGTKAQRTDTTRDIPATPQGQVTNISCDTGNKPQEKTVLPEQDTTRKTAAQPAVPPTTVRTATETQVPAKAIGTPSSTTQASPAQPASQELRQPVAASKQQAKKVQPRNNIVKTDKFIAIAIIAAIIAIAAIIYGILANPTPDIEIVIDPAQSAVEAPANPAPASAQPAK